MAVINRDTIWKLTGCIQHYPWGGKSYLPELLCLTNSDDKPFAELWFGQHPACPSVTSGGTTLSDLMASSPETFLIPEEQDRWKNELPYLCKILDVRDMLSIQIHPDRNQAESGYHEEQKNYAGIDSFKRTFRDKNHKPEIMYALSDFYLLHDFRSDEEVVEVLSNISSLQNIADQIKTDGLPEFYKTFMQQSQRDVNYMLKPFIEELKSMKVSDHPMNPDYWVTRAVEQFCTDRKIDRGILSIFLMNLVHLKPGEVIFQDSGVPHAYLRGQNIEIMANSDNVIRGGLTKKHINSNALSRLVRFDKRTVHRLPAVQVDDFQTLYTPPVEEFQLSVIDLEPYQEYSIETRYLSLLFSTCNCFIAKSDRQEIRVGGGEAVLVRARETIVIMSRMKAKLFLVKQNSNMGNH